MPRAPKKKRTRRRVAAAGVEKAAEITMERKAIGELKPHPRNPRKHPTEGTSEWMALRESLQHDYYDPLVWNKRNGMLVSGHLRTKILTKDGFTHADVVVVDYDEMTHLGRMLSANHLVGEDDWQLRKDVFEELISAHQEGSIHLEKLTGATLSSVDEELEGLRAREIEEAEAEENAERNKERFDAVLVNCKEPESEVHLGEVWKLGRHRLICSRLTTPPFLWKDQLDAMFEEENQDVDVRFIPYPDPYWALTDHALRLCLVQPDPFLAGHMLDNYNAQNPNSPAELVEL